MTANQEKELFEILNRIASSLETIADEVANPMGVGSSLQEISSHLEDIKDKLKDSPE